MYFHRDWNMLNDLMYEMPQTATRPVLLCYISTSLGPLIRSCASAAAHMDLFHYLADLLLRTTVFKSHLDIL